MEKRIFAAVGLSIAVLWLWAAIAPKLFPDLVKPRTTETKPAASSTAAPTSTATAAPSAPTSATSAEPAPATAVAAVPGVAPAAPREIIRDTARRDVIVEAPDYRARFSNRGAQLTSLELVHYLAKTKKRVDLVKPRPADRTDYPFAIESRDADINRRLNTGLYTVNDSTTSGVRTIEFRFADERIAATKRFRFRGEFLFDVETRLQPPIPYRIVIGPGLRELAADEQSIDTEFISTGNGVMQIDGSLEIVNRQKAAKFESYDNAQFIGVEDSYFLVALKPEHAGPAILRAVDLPIDVKSKRRDLYVGLNAAPDGVVRAAAFFGPKQTTVLEKHGLESTLQFGWFGFIARLLLDALLWINQATKNYGFAIIVLTIIIKIILYPLQHKSIVSMKRMQKLQPKMEAIKAKYKKARTDPEQRQKMNVEMMKLYQQEKINPMSGCLPILLQLPILWGFYGMLSRAIELRGAPFMLWIDDLSAKDPYYITPILMTATMFIQTLITPTTADPVQKKIFLAMPIVFGWIFKEFPSGLVLYWLVQNILTIIQQLIMNKYWKDHPDDPPPPKIAATT